MGETDEPMSGAEGSLLDIIDFAVSACLVYLIIVWLKDARARLALIGVALVGATYLLALTSDLTLTARLLQAAFFVSAVMLLLVFQEDLRRAFERLAIVVLRRVRPTPTAGAVDAVARAAFQLAALRRGALIVISGREPIERHLEGGVPLDGVVSEPLLLGLFDPKSPSHDGAVLLDANRVRRFSVHLPLSSDFAQLGNRGTRHAAALGISERCDAVALVVSEERGSVSLARAGTLRPLATAADLAPLLRTLPDAPRAPDRAPRSRYVRLRTRLGQIALAVFVSALLWVLIVPGSQTGTSTLPVPIQVDNLPSGFAVAAVVPSEVKVTLSGSRRALFFLRSGGLRLAVDASMLSQSRRTFEVSARSVKCPPGIVATEVRPTHVQVDAHRVP